MLETWYRLLGDRSTHSLERMRGCRKRRPDRTGRKVQWLDLEMAAACSVDRKGRKGGEARSSLEQTENLGIDPKRRGTDLSRRPYSSSS